MARREQQIEHLLRRAGFGGSPDEVDLYAELGLAGATDILLNFEQVPDDVGLENRASRLRRRDDARRVPAQREHHGCAATVAVPDGPYAAAAPGEDGALLAQPLRHGLQQDQRDLRRQNRDRDDGRQARRIAGRREGPARTVPAIRAGQLPRPADRHRQGSGDAGVARRTAEHQDQAAGELRARDHGAVHVRRRARP